MSGETTTQSGRGGLIAAALFFIAALAAGAWIGFGGVGPDEISQSRDMNADVQTVAAAPTPAAPVRAPVRADSDSSVEPPVPQPSPEAAVEADTPPATAPSGTEQIATEAAPQATTPAEVAPTFDEIRREDDGTTVIAGQAAPGASVTVKVDGAPVATAQADSSGSFAAVSSVPGTAAPQVMTLETENDTVSKEEIILAPLPVQPAPEAQPEVSQTTATVQALGGEDSSPAPVLPDATEPPVPTAAPRVALLKSDEEGVQLLAQQAPSAMSRVALDTIGYDARGEVQLAGRAQSEASEVRIYLDNKAVVSIPVGGDGRWQGDLPNIDEGVYTLRVDELRADGSVSSRVETPFQRESASVLANAQRDANGNIVAITVQKGNTLWAIARERYGEGTLYVKVFEANKSAIRDPDLIYPGQIFDLPQ